MEEIKHERPGDNPRTPEKRRSHMLVLNVDGKEVAYAEMRYYNDPFPYYWVDWLVTMRKSDYGKGFGSKALHGVEDFLEKHGKPGILDDQIARGNSMHAYGMYERHGWKVVYVKDTDMGVQYVRMFNRPENLSDMDIEKAILKHDDKKLRGSLGFFGV